MSYSPLTGLVYIPTLEQWMVVSRLPDGEFKFVLGKTTLGAGVNTYPELRKQLKRGSADARQGLHPGVGSGEAENGVSCSLRPAVRRWHDGDRG